MCGRYAFDDIKEIFEARMILEEIADVFGQEMVLSIKKGDVFPTDTAAVVAQNEAGYQPMAMEWGYKMWNSSRRIINARKETLMEKPMFRNSVISKKCLIPCTGFYEWQKIDSGKQKYKISPENETFFYLAGLYNTFEEDSIQINRFVIITCPANRYMRKIHPRMPLIVPKSQKEAWFIESENYNNQISKIYQMTNELDTIAL
jgi:putative SOS response-associated peptidase YedK